MIGTILNERWKILAELGRGGMGEVFLAEHLELGRKEALKILMPGLAGDPQFVARFRREARAVNRLRHPNIISVYDFGQLADGRFYLAMEYADGEPLQRLLKIEGRFAVPRALGLLGQLSYAVHHAHSRGVVHRDLKPDNLILVGAEETLKVLDFGVAKIVGSDHAESVAVSSANLIYGTARYLAPERIRGIGTDPRSDLYSIGCIAYELVVGKPVFAGKSDDVILAQLKEAPQVPSDAKPGAKIPPELDAAILKALAKEPEDRFQTAAELFAALRKVPGYPAARGEPRRRYVPLDRQPTDLGGNRAPTDPEAFGELRGALRDLAEALLDLGLTDLRLVGGLARLRDNEQSLAGLEAAQDALEHEAAGLRETTGDREASLRFAISEMRYASEADVTMPIPDLQAKIAELEGRLGDATAQGEQLRALDERLRAVTEMRAKGLERLVSAYDTLDRVVDELLPAHLTHPSIAPLAHRLSLVRARRPATAGGA